MLENITFEDTIYLNDMLETVYNYNGKRIFLLNNNFDKINYIINDKISNDIMPYGIFH
jgi:hypothetical protein